MNSRIFRRCLEWLCLSLVLPATLDARQPKWTKIGPEGGNIISLARHARLDSVLYALSDDGTRVFLSRNKGANWVERSHLPGDASKLLINRWRPGSIYALSASGRPKDLPIPGAGMRDGSQLLESKDGGRRWSTRSFPPIYAIQCVSFDPRDPKVVHAVGRSTTRGTALYLRSTDQGVTWTTTVVPAGRISAATIAIDSLEEQNIYIGVRPERLIRGLPVLFKSSDGGKEFSTLTIARGELGTVSDVIIDPLVRKRAFVIGQGRMYWSSDGGAKWQQCTPPCGSIQKAWIDPQTADHLVAVVDSGLAESRDGGATWNVSTAKIPGDRTSDILVDIGSQGEIIVANTAGIFSSNDHGKSWMTRHRGIFASQVTALRIDLVTPSVLYAGLMSNALYKTTSAASSEVTWKALPVFYDGACVGDVQIVRKRIPRLVAFERSESGATHLFVSADNGAHWVKTDGRLDDGHALEVAGEVLFLAGSAREVPSATARCAVVRSIDGGATWSQSYFAEDWGTMRALAARSGGKDLVFAGGQVWSNLKLQGLVFKSIDGGATWNQMPDLGASQNVSAICIDPHNPKKVLVGTDIGVWFSDNEGAEWTPPVQNLNVTCLVANPSKKNEFFIGSGKGVWSTADGGKDWRRLGVGLSDATITRLALDPKRLVLYAGTQRQGVTRLNVRSRRK